MAMKYIFIAGAPGSKWSSVTKNIYFSPNVDNSDYSDARTYYHDASGTMDLMHLGAYFDPGMEFELPEYLTDLAKEDAEKLFDKPFSGIGVRIVKSHIFSYTENIEYLRKNWPDCPIVLVYRPDDACLGWWVKCGHFNITYPLYQDYYKDLKTMAKIIKQQNEGIRQAMLNGSTPLTNHSLCKMLNIQLPPDIYFQDYGRSDVRVTVI